MAKITLGGNETNTNGTLPAVGTTLNNYNFVKNDMAPVSLSDLTGKTLILNILVYLNPV